MRLAAVLSGFFTVALAAAALGAAAPPPSSAATASQVSITWAGPARSGPPAGSPAPAASVGTTQLVSATVASEVATRRTADGGVSVSGTEPVEVTTVTAGDQRVVTITPR